MKCEHCGNEEVVDGAKFCGKCGGKINFSKAVEEVKIHHKKTEEKSSVGTRVISFIVFILAIGVSKYIAQEAFPSSSVDLTTPKSINEIVTSIKAKTVLPNKLDEVTTLVDVTAEPSAIRYHYVIEGADTSALSNSAFRDLLLPKLCENPDTRKGLLDKNVGMQYSYIVKETGESYYVAVTKNDCQK